MRRLQALRAAATDLGPLRWVVLASAVLPTTGLCLLLANLPALAAAWRLDAFGFVAAAAAIAVATGALLLPPSVAAFAAGYLFGPGLGAMCALPAIALGGVSGQRVVWPLVGASLYAFMQGRPRLETVRAFCAVPLPAAVLRVAIVRAAARVPFSVINLLLSAAKVPSAAVFAGTLVAAVPLAWLAGGIGAAWRQWREHALAPSPLQLTSLFFAASVAALAMVAAQRSFARASAR